MVQSSVVFIISLGLVCCVVSSQAITIDTPEKLEQLRNGAFNDYPNVVYVTSGAHPNVFSLPKEFWNCKFLQMHFTDGDNKIYIHPEHKYVGGRLSAGANLTLGMPTNYEYYGLVFGSKVTITDDDVNYMLQWRQAKTFEFTDYGDFSLRLVQRFESGARLDRLEKLTLSVRRHTYEMLKVKPFLTSMPSLTYARFRYPDLDFQQVRQFSDKQSMAPWWGCRTEAESMKCVKELRWTNPEY